MGGQSNRPKAIDIKLGASRGPEKLVVVRERQFDRLWYAAVALETSVEMGGPHVEHELSPKARPPHLALFAHALIDQLVDRGFDIGG